MLLAADVGGTKTLLGVFRPDGERPRPVVVREFATLDFDSLDDIVQTFLDETGPHTIQAVCIGVAGPVNGLVARLTNVPWLADASGIADRLDGRPVLLVNDLEAMAHAVPVLAAEELHTLQPGRPDPRGNAALIAAGTGLGAAILHRVGERMVPVPSETFIARFTSSTKSPR